MEVVALGESLRLIAAEKPHWSQTIYELMQRRNVTGIFPNPTVLMQWQTRESWVDLNIVFWGQPRTGYIIFMLFCDHFGLYGV